MMIKHALATQCSNKRKCYDFAHAYWRVNRGTESSGKPGHWAVTQKLISQWGHTPGKPRLREQFVLELQTKARHHKRENRHCNCKARQREQNQEVRKKLRELSIKRQIICLQVLNFYFLVDFFSSVSFVPSPTHISVCNLRSFATCLIL